MHALFKYTDIVSSIYTLFILSTLDNYPDLLLGVYNENFQLMPFYYIFTVFGSIVMISVLTGVFYTNFKEFYSANVAEQLEEEKFRVLLQNCLKDDYLNFDNIKKELNNYIQDFRILQDQEKEIESRSALLELTKIEIKRDNEENEGLYSEEESSESLDDDLMNQFKSHANSGTAGKDQIAGELISLREDDEILEIDDIMNAQEADDIDIVQSNYLAYKLFFTLLDFIIMVLPVIQLEFKVTDNKPLNFYVLSEILNMTVLIDPLIERKTKGNAWLMRRLNIYKITTSILIIIFSNILQFIQTSMEGTEIYEHKIIYRIWCLLSLLKVLSIHDLLKNSPEYSLIISTFTQIMPLLQDMFLMVFILTMVYAVIGVYLLGGMVSSESVGLYKKYLDEKLEDNYWYLTFNDIPSGILFMYCLLMNNDWSKFSTMTLLAFDINDMSSIWAGRFFFFTYYFLGFMVVLNIIIGSIIDFIVCYLTILDKKMDSGNFISNLTNINGPIQQKKKKTQPLYML